MGELVPNSGENKKRKMMLAFICLQKPLSYNAQKKHRYEEVLRTAYSEYNSGASFADAPLYGCVYYFHTDPTNLDADNLSKPVWDALKGLSYLDDSLISLRHAGILKLKGEAFEPFDLSRLPDQIADRLIEVLGTEPHVLYVEIGQIEPEMFEFGRMRSVEPDL